MKNKSAIFYDRRRKDYMKIEKLRIGKTYYLPQRGCPTSYTSGVLVEIVSKNKVILENNVAPLSA